MRGKIVSVITSFFIYSGSCNVFSQTNDEYNYLMLFSNILNHVKTNYIDVIPPEELYKGAIEGVFQKLDPHTHYLSQENLIRFSQISEGESFGVGIEFEIIENIPTVVSVIEDSPADSKNIKTGDVLIEIDDKKIEDNISSADLLLLLYGEIDTEVRLKLKRNEEINAVSLKREKLNLKSVTVTSIIEPNVGYIKCTNFSHTTPDEFKDALKYFKKDKIQKLIIDLRDNPGGILESSIKVADLFLPDGKKIVSTSGRKDLLIKEYLSEDGEDFQMKLVVLINNGTASASEVLTGCFQDHKRAYILGTPSFGKGLIQSTFLLNNGGAIMMTIGEYRTPLGRKIQREYKGKNFHEYYKEVNSRNDLGKDSVVGGIYPDSFLLNNPILDSIENSSSYEEIILKNAVTNISNFQMEQSYKSYDQFKKTFKEKELIISGLTSTNEEIIKIMRDLIKTKIAKILWGNLAEFDSKRNLDIQLQSAINYLKTQ